MRRKLHQQNKDWIEVTAKVERYGSMRNGRPTILLANVRNIASGELLTDHVWSVYTGRFKKAGAQPGDKVRFTGKVKAYLKGARHDTDGNYVPLQIDYNIRYIGKVEVVK